jgi:hypothetical protein
MTQNPCHDVRERERGAQQARRLAVLGVLLVGCSQSDPPAPPAREPSKAKAAIASPAGCEGVFDPPPQAKNLCIQRVISKSGEIHWTSWAVPGSAADAFTAYEARARACGAEVTGLKVSKGEHRLSVHEGTEKGYPSCETSPPANHAVVIISVMYQR